MRSFGLIIEGGKAIRAQGTDRIAMDRADGYDVTMIIIRFPDDATKKRALGYLAGRFSFKSWATGEMMVPPDALAELAMQNLAFQVEGPASYEQLTAAVRSPSAAAVQ